MSEIHGDQPWSVPELPLAPARRALASGPLPARRNGAAAPAGAQNAPAATANEPSLHLWIVLAYFIVAFSTQLLLLIPQFSVFRIELRIIPFALSILLVLLPPPGRAADHRMHPGLPFAGIFCCILMFGLLHQETDSALAGLAQIALNFSILAPLLWVGRLNIGIRGFSIILLCLWGFNATSAGFGALQIYFPGHFQPATSTVVQEIEDQGIAYNIELADGTQTVRPYGLTDQPGGAAAAGLTAFVFGLGLLVSSKNLFMRVLYLLGMGVGLFVMYLSQVRVSIVMCGVATIAFVTIMALRGEFARLTGALLGLTVIIAVSTSAAFVIGGSQTRDRFFTLVDDNAQDVYANNRGAFLEYTFYYALPTYPFGAGLGRYGMMSHYFAQGSAPLWAEIQWTAWAYDGGWPLVISYPLAILAALWTSFKIGRGEHYGPMGLWGSILTSYNISVIAVLFSYPFFESQSGLEFWILNAAVFSAGQFYLNSHKVVVPKGFEVIPAPWRPNMGSASSPAAFEESAPRRRPLERRRLPVIAPVFDQPDRD